MWMKSRMKNDNLTITRDDPLRHLREFQSIYGVSLSEFFDILYNEGKIHENSEISFLEEFQIYLKNNEDKFFINIPSTMAIALYKFIKHKYGS